MPRKCNARIMSLMLAFFLVVTYFCQGVFFSGGVSENAYAAEDENVATAVLTDRFELHNFTEVRMGGKEDINYLVREGTRSWFMDNASKQDSSFMYFNLSDSFANKVSDGSVFDIEFEYYSQDEGWFQIKYDSQRKEEKNGDIIYVGNSKSWEKATVTLEDAYFDNRVLGAYDFILTIQALGNGTIFSPGDIAIRNVRVTKHPARNPITNYCTIEESGNIFSDFQDEKIIYNNLKNTTDKEMTVELKNSAVTTGGEVKWKGSQSVILAPNEEKAVPVNVQTDWCDLYDYRTEIVGDGFTSEFKTHRFAIVKTDPDGVRNERYYINIHPERWRSTAPEMAEVLAKMNAKGVRMSYGWKNVQWSNTVGIGYGQADQKVHQALTDNGVSFLICLNQLSSGYPTAFNPANTDSVEQYKKAIEFIVNNMPEDTIYEMWNEPMADFVRTGDLTTRSPEGFAFLSALTVDLVHQLKPDAKVGVWSLCAMVQDQVFKRYYLPGMESDYKIWENADALAMHPYTRLPMERSTMKDVTIKRYLDEFYKRGREDIEVWNTEIGFTKLDSDIGTEENKAAYNARLFTYLTGEDLNDIYAHYNFEQKGIVMSNRECNFGIVTCGDPSVADIYGNNYVATESYVTAAAQNYLMPQITPDGNFTKDNVMAYKFKSEKFGQELVSMWGINHDEVRKVDLGTNRVRYFDVNGNETELTSEDGTYTFDITHQPFYLVGDINKVEILDTAPDFELSQKEHSILTGDILSVQVNKNVEGDYTIDVETPEYMALREKTEFSDGKATLSFDILSEFEDNAYILLNIRDKSGRLAEKLEIRCTMTERAVTSDITSSLVGFENLNRWKVKVTVKNESNTYLKRGYIKFNSPGDFAQLQKADIGPIPPQKTAAIEINCPEIVEKGMYNLNYDIVLDDGNSYNFAKAVDFTVSNKMNADKPIVIDGVIGNDEWDKSAAMYLNTIEQVTGYEDWGGKNDLSGYYIVSWDEDNFYLCANVTDDIHSQDKAVKSMESGDSAMFGVYHDIETYIVSGQGNVDYHGVVLGLTNEGPKAYRNKSQTFNAIAVGEMTDQVELAIKREGNKTYYEYKCPWETLLGYEYTPEVGSEMWFASTLNENDGKGKRGYMQFSSGLGSTKNVYLFAKLKFIDAN